MKRLGISLAALFFSASAYALPALQIGNGSTGDWSWDAATETWVSSSSAFSVDVVANGYGERGGYAWATADETRTAYLVFAAAPQTADATDVFDLSLSAGLTFVESGYGAAPLDDPNSLAPHGIYDTYYEVYSFVFDGPLTDIYNVQPGDVGTGLGYVESIDVSVTRIDAGVVGVHMDLYTVDNNGQVYSFAPFSHDAEYAAGTTAKVSEPSTLFLFVGSMLLLAGMSRRKRS